jgi:hypothetical protein
MLAIRRRLAGRRITVGEDKAYDTTDHVARLRDLDVTPKPADGGAAPSHGASRRMDARRARRLANPSDDWRLYRLIAELADQVAEDDGAIAGHSASRYWSSPPFSTTCCAAYTSARGRVRSRCHRFYITYHDDGSGILGIVNDHLG